MTCLQFTISGNHENPEGNPVPYTRVLNHSWRGDSVRYMRWCGYVRKQLLKSLNEVSIEEMRKEGSSIGILEGKLRVPKEKKVRVGISVAWASNTHGDLDNVLKGILDSVFENDKNVCGFTARAAPAKDKKGKVDVVISII